MPFHLSELQEKDCAEFAELDALAMAGWPVAVAMELEAQKNGQSRQQMIEGWMRMAFQKANPNVAWLKVTESETERIVSVAAWSWQLEDTVAAETKAEAPNSAKGEKADDEQPRSIFDALREEQQQFKAEFFPSQKHYNLNVLCTHPQWRRQGAGSLLVEYGCAKADEAGVICVLQSTDAGLGLYLSNGFQVVKAIQLDLRPFGVDASELRRWMVRQPKTQ